MWYWLFDRFMRLLWIVVAFVLVYLIALGTKWFVVMALDFYINHYVR